VDRSDPRFVHVRAVADRDLPDGVDVEGAAEIREFPDEDFPDFEKHLEILAGQLRQDETVDALAGTEREVLVRLPWIRRNLEVDLLAVTSQRLFRVANSGVTKCFDRNRVTLSPVLFMEELGEGKGRFRGVSLEDGEVRDEWMKGFLPGMTRVTHALDDMIRLQDERERLRIEQEEREEIKETGPSQPDRPLRLAIPGHVRREVWRRDEGRCEECGSRERLEFDHIIPVSRGGSNTARNIRLLCERCNREKGASI
jgi:hypothetical protein